MASAPLAVKENSQYFTPRDTRRIPVSEDDWLRLRRLAEQGDSSPSWPSFLRSLSLGVLASALLNLIQLTLLSRRLGTRHGSGYRRPPFLSRH